MSDLEVDNTDSVGISLLVEIYKHIFLHPFTFEPSSIGQLSQRPFQAVT